MTRADIIVVGAGIAGLSAAAELVTDRHQQVIVLEAEEHIGYHASGRSASFFATAYGNDTVRAITACCETFLRSPPKELTEVELLRPRDYILMARADQQQALAREAERMASKPTTIDATTICQRVPIIRPDYPESGLLVSNGGDLDADALLQGYLRQFKRHGGKMATSTRVSSLHRRDNVWQVSTDKGKFSAPLIVNAAGAWADRLGKMAALGSLDISPKKRTACLLKLPPQFTLDDWPMVTDVDEQFYFKPDAGMIMLSPCDETDSEAADVYADELDVAIAADRFQQATTVEVRRIQHSWAGLRTFAADRTPVVGFDPRTEGLFWLAGQGGYGVQIAPALAQLTRYLVTGHSLPRHYQVLTSLIDKLAPERLLRVG